MDVPSKPINVTKLNCRKNSKVEIIAAVNTDKRTLLAAFVVVGMEIWKPLVSPHVELGVAQRTSFRAETLQQQLYSGPRYHPKGSLSSLDPERKEAKEKLR